MIKIAGFAPDADKTTPGILTDCENLIPNIVGMTGAPSAVTPSGVPALAAACQGASVVTKLDGTRRLIAGTATKLYELSSGTWTDRTRVGDYTGGVESNWAITQFGDATLAANRQDTIQRSTTGAFADIATAPKAQIIFSVGAFVMALNVNDGAEKPDGWHCCAAYDDTSWTPSTATQATSGRLVATAGQIIAGGKLGEYAVAYKNRSMYLGQYVGAPVVWDWVQVIGGNAGCIGRNAWCDLDGTHFFVGEDNFWLFDGTRPTPLADGVLRQWFASNCAPSYKYKIICTYDKLTNLVWVFYPSTNSSTLDSALVYHVTSKRWGRANRAIQVALEYTASSITINGLDALSATINELPNIPFDSQYWLSGGRAMSVFDTSNQLQSLMGNSTSSSMTTGDVGDDDAVTLLQQIRLRYETQPTTATALSFSTMQSGGSMVAGPSGTLNDGKFDMLKSARWHMAKISFTGPVTVTGMKAKFKTVGTR